MVRGLVGLADSDAHADLSVSPPERQMQSRHAAIAKPHHRNHTVGHRSYSIASLLVLLFVASMTLAVARSIAGMGFESIYPVGFIASFTSLWFLAASARRRGWPTMAVLSLGLHLHPFSCWVVQQEFANYSASLVALRYALVLVPAVWDYCDHTRTRPILPSVVAQLRPTDLSRQ